MQLIKSALFVFIFIQLLHQSKAQDPINSLESFKDNFEIEKIFIHYDKENYIAGETIWFKAYLMAGGVPSAYSSTLSVYLLNDSGRILNKKILPVVNSAAVGEFEISNDLPQAKYTILAYTKRLMNFGSDFYYKKQLSVFNPSSDLKNANTPEENMIYFLPEGGYLISGISNTIAFKSTDKFGYPVKVDGEIKDKKGEVVADLMTVHNGMGKFQITPNAGEQYYAEVSFNGGPLKKVNLPLSKVSGTGFQVLHADQKLFFLINTEKIANEIQRPAYLLAVRDNEVLFKTTLNPDKVIKGQIPTDKIPSGIIQLTIFNSENSPLNERLVFINNKELEITSTLQKSLETLLPRGKNEYSLTIPDTIVGTFSVSITDYNKTMPNDDKEHILSAMLLSSNVKDYIYNPAWYFENTDTKTKSALDLVMLTSGWRGYNWDQIMYNRLPALSHFDEEYISVRGTAYNAFNKQKLKNATLFGTVTVGDSTGNFLSIPVDENGNFEMKGLVFSDTAKITFQNTDKKNKATNLVLSTSPISAYYTYTPGFQNSKPINIPPAVEQSIKNNYLAILRDNEKKILMLEDVRIAAIHAKSKMQKLEDKYISNGVFGGSARTTLDFINDPPRNTGINILDYLKGRLPGVDITGSVGTYYVQYRSARSLFGGNIEMAVFLDEVQVPTNQVSTIRVADVAMVKVLGTGSAVMTGSGGALVIYTRKGEDRILTANNFLQTIKIEGYSPIKDFFEPDYSIQGEEMGEDKRTTLYWNPYLTVDTESRTLHFPFYNSDEAKKLKVIVTGMTADGKMLYLNNTVE